MKVVIDVEADGLENPTQIWCVVCKDIDTNKQYIFRSPEINHIREPFLQFAEKVDLWIGHNWLGYDYPVLNKLLGLVIEDVAANSIDTLIISKLVNYSRKGHSIEDYGKEFGLVKFSFSDFSKWSQQMEDYCVRDVDICHRIYEHFHPIHSDPIWRPAILLEHQFQLIVNNLHNNGFAFDTTRANNLLARVMAQLGIIDEEILDAFPARLRLIREIVPRVTKFGTINRSDFRWIKGGDLSEYNGGPFCRCSWEEFNPSSVKQTVDVLHAAGWQPTDKTKTHIEVERELNFGNSSIDLQAKRAILKKYGWKINENNLSTLPDCAPPPARLLAKRILLESRRRTLVEWLSLVREDGRIHGKFYSIGAWTHRMAHQNPNTANIPGEYREDGTVKLYGKEMRQLWRAPKNRLLVGVDAEGIQLRIFAHYIDDQEFTDALVRGKKSDGSDPHSLNKRIMGSVCNSRQAAKRFIYALLLGAGLGKLAEILGCSRTEAEEALSRILERYSGFAYLKNEVIPRDARRGFFIGIDGRRVVLPGETNSNRRHLAMSGYLQNGEAIVMKKASLKWARDVMLVDMIHDEWQIETSNNMKLAIQIAERAADSLRIVGEELNLKCPLAGSYWNDDHKDYTIGTNWYQTH